jgi:hypothetical protein
MEVAMKLTKSEVMEHQQQAASSSSEERASRFGMQRPTDSAFG